MTAEVIDLKVISKLPIPVGKILGAAAAVDLDVAIVVGTDKDGEFYFASSEPDGGIVLWWLEMAKKKLLEIGDPQ